MSETPSPRSGSTDGRKKPAKPRLFEFRDCWLLAEQKGERTYYFKAWYDVKSGQRRRKALGNAKDLEAAKEALIASVLEEAPKTTDKPSDVLLATVLQLYLDAKADEGMRSMSAAQRACDLVIQYMSDNGFPAATVADFDLAWQHDFHKWCHKTLDLTAKSISTYCTTIRAAFKMAATPKVVEDGRGTKRTVKVLSECPYVEATESKIANRLKLSKSKKRSFAPSLEEMAAFMDAIGDEHVFRFAIMSLNMWARPEAIYELDVGTQVDFEEHLIEINPEGRFQTNKIRPTIRLTEGLAGWLKFWNLDRPIVFQGRPARHISERTIKKTAKRAGIEKWDQFIPYTFRHFMGTRIRAVPNFQVSREERAQWLGHVDKKNRTTEEWYETFDPEFLAGPARATDALIRMVDVHCTRRLFTAEPLPKASVYLASTG